MKVVLLIHFLILSCSVLLGQGHVQSTSRYMNSGEVKSNQQRYKVDYELIDYEFNGDSTILDRINLRSIEYLRHDTQDQVFRDLDNGINILLYSQRRINKDIKEIK